MLGGAGVSDGIIFLLGRMAGYMVAHRCEGVLAMGGRRIQNSEFGIQNGGEREWGGTINSEGENGAIWNHFGALLEVF